MTTLREAAQMALDELKYAQPFVLSKLEAIEALRAALAQPEQEPVAWVYPDGLEALKNRKCWTAYGTHQNGMMRPLYTAPPQREWQGLTDEEILIIYNTHTNANEWGYERAIEAKLREKNAND